MRVSPLRGLTISSNYRKIRRIGVRISESPLYFPNFKKLPIKSDLNSSRLRNSACITIPQIILNLFLIGFGQNDLINCPYKKASMIYRKNWSFAKFGENALVTLLVVVNSIFHLFRSLYYKNSMKQRLTLWKMPKMKDCGSRRIAR